MEYSKFHSIPFQVFPVELEWNFPYVCTYVLRKLYLSTYYHVRKIVITLFSEPEPPPVVSLFLRKEL